MDVRECLLVYLDSLQKVSVYLSKLPHLTSARVFRAWEAGGLLTPQYAADGELERLWVNVVAHQAAAAVLGYHLSSRLVGPERVSDIVEALLVHDCFKRREQELKDSAKRSGENQVTASHSAELQTSDFLKRLGFSSRICFLVSTTGDIGLEKMMSGKATLDEKIVFYSDCCVSNDEIVGYKRRFDHLKPHFQPGGRYDYVDHAYHNKYGRTHREVWDSVVLPIEQEIIGLIDFQGSPERLYTIAL